MKGNYKYIVILLGLVLIWSTGLIAFNSKQKIDEAPQDFILYEAEYK